MIKRYIIYFVVLAMLLGLGGCMLAQPEAGEENVEQRDRLIGCFITTEYIDLFDFDAYFNDHASELVNGGDVTIDSTEGYNGRIYAEYYEETLTGEDGETITTGNYEFPGLEGVAYFAPKIGEGENSYITFQTGEGLQDVHNAVRSVGDKDTHYTELSGRIYVPSGNDRITFYMNPVYQNSEGRVYLCSGQGLQTDITAGTECAMKLSEETTVTIDGVEYAGGGKVEVWFEVVNVPSRVRIVEMSADGEALAVAEFEPLALPGEYEPREGTAYIILESFALDGEGGEAVERCVLAPDSEDEDIFVMMPGENGYMTFVYAEVLWGEE